MKKFYNIDETFPLLNGYISHRNTSDCAWKPVLCLWLDGKTELCTCKNWI